MATPETSALKPAGDIFLWVETDTGGWVRGESSDQNHKEYIELIGWSWGMSVPVASSGSGSGKVTGKANVKGLRVVKCIDRSSPILMQTLLKNDPAEVRLIMRKAGREALEYLVIRLEHARVVNYEVQTGIEGGVSIPLEEWTFSFGRVEVVYTPQRSDGLGGGGVTVTHDLWTGAV